MSVHWRWDKKAWMASEVFLGSFHNCFLEAERYLHGKNLAFTVLLILDNAPVHCCWELKNAYPDIEVVLMPPNMASLIQALNQDMIKAFQLEKEEMKNPRFSRRKEILKIRELKRTIARVLTILNEKQKEN